MVKHRGLSLAKFCAPMPFDLFRTYFERLSGEARPGEWAYLNLDQMLQFLEAPENAQAAGVVREEFQRINDVCIHSAVDLVRAHEEFGVDYDGDKTPQEMAMRLFLFNAEAFEYAWSLFLWRAKYPRASQYFLPAGTIERDEDRRAQLEAFLQGHFFQQKKGRDCIVRMFPDRGGLVVLVSRGNYMKTDALWERGQVVFSTFRPATEDVLVYKPTAERLTIKASNSDRNLYLAGFARFVAGDQNLADIALDTPTFSLDAIRNGKFGYRGRGQIRNVYLREAVLQLKALGLPVLVIRSDNVVRTLKEDLKTITLRSGDLKSVRLAFEFYPGTRRRANEIVVEVAPPAYSDVSSKADADEIDAYLREEGVKLI